MMKVESWLLIATCILSCLSCDADKLRKESASFIGKKMSVPYDKMVILPKDSSITSTERNSQFVYISYLDSLECSPCQMSKVNKWEEIDSLFIDAKLPFNVTLIFAAKSQSVHTLWKSYVSNGCIRKIYVDTANVFVTTNTFLPRDKRLHTLLLNPEGEIVLIGNPISNVKIKKLLCEYLDSYITNQ